MKSVIGPSVFFLWTMRSAKYAYIGPRLVSTGMMNASLCASWICFEFGTATTPFP